MDWVIGLTSESRLAVGKAMRLPIHPPLPPPSPPPPPSQSVPTFLLLSIATPFRAEDIPSADWPQSPETLPGILARNPTGEAREGREGGREGREGERIEANIPNSPADKWQNGPNHRPRCPWRRIPIDSNFNQLQSDLFIYLKSKIERLDAINQPERDKNQKLSAD